MARSSNWPGDRTLNPVIAVRARYELQAFIGGTKKITIRDKRKQALLLSRTCRYSVIVNISAFQADITGSSPVIDSMLLSSNGRTTDL